MSDLIPETGPAELAAVRAWWASGGPAAYSSDRFTTIAGGARDQVTPSGISNPYWDIIREMPCEASYMEWEGLTPYGYAPGLIETCNREKLVGRYVWSIPSPGDLTWMTGILDG